MDTMSATDDRRATHDLDAEQRQWQSWIDAVCADLGVPAALVDVAAIHELSRQVAHGLARPLAPVSTFILGVALGRALCDSEQATDPASPQAADLVTDLATYRTDALSRRITAHV
jgi:hypothetical protein